MGKEHKDMPRTDGGKDVGIGKPLDVGKTGGELGKQGGQQYGKPIEPKETEKKEWEVTDKKPTS